MKKGIPVFIIGVTAMFLLSRGDRTEPISAMEVTPPEPVRNLPASLSPIEPEAPKAKEIFPNSRLGTALTALLSLRPNAEIPSPEARAFQVAWDDVFQNPRESFLLIEEALNDSPFIPEQERAFLLQVAVKLDIDEKSKIDFLKKEIFHSSVAEGEARFSRAIALNRLLTLDDDRPAVKQWLNASLEESNLGTDTHQLLMAEFGSEVTSLE